MHEAGEAAQKHAAAEAERHAHVLQVGLVDRSGVVGEAVDHGSDSTGRAGKRLATFARAGAELSIPFQRKAFDREILARFFRP